jgi:hypothetical protein
MCYPTSVDPCQTGFRRNPRLQENPGSPYEPEQNYFNSGKLGPCIGKRARWVPPWALGNLCLVSFRHARSSQGTRRACTKCGSKGKASQATSVMVRWTQEKSNSIRAAHARKCRLHQRKQSINLGIDGAVLRHPVGNPKRKVWGAQHQVSLSCETKVYRTSRRKPNFRRWCLLASQHSGQQHQKSTGA